MEERNKTPHLFVPRGGFKSDTAQHRRPLDVLPFQGVLETEYRAAPDPPPPVAHIGRGPPRVFPPFQCPRVENFHRIHVSPPVEIAVPVEDGPPEHVKFAVEGDQTTAGVLELRRKRQLIDDEPGVGRLAVALDPARGKGRETMSGKEVILKAFQAKM